MPQNRIPPTARQTPAEKGRMVEVFFIIDRSESMHDDFAALRANIDLLIPELEKSLQAASVDCRFGVVAEDSSLRWPWQDLGTLAQLKTKLAEITCGRGNEATPQAMDYVLENASWDPARRGFLVVFTDEPAEGGGMACSLEQFHLVMAKIMAKGLGLLLIGMPGCFRKGTHRKIYDYAADYPRVFLTDRLRDDRGEKLIQWLAASLSNAGVGVPQRAQTPPKDIFGVFSKVKLV